MVTIGYNKIPLHEAGMKYKLNTIETKYHRRAISVGKFGDAPHLKMFSSNELPAGLRLDQLARFQDEL